MKKKQQAESPAAHDASPLAHDDKLQLFERISDAFVALDKNWCYTYVNQKAGVIMRKDPEQMIGRHILAEFPGIEGQPYYLGFEKAMREQVYVYIEEYLSVNERWFEFHIYPSAEGISVFFREITDRKLAELNLQKANRLYNFISQVNQLIVRTKDQENLFREVCEIAVRLGKFKLAWIGLLDDKTGTVNPVAFAGVEDGYLTHIKKIHISLDQSGKGPTGSAIRKGEIVVSHDIENDPGMLAWREEAMKRGYRSSIAVPIRRGGKVIGAFSLYAGEKHFFDTSEVALLEEATGDISFSLDVYENERKRNEAESALRTSEIKLRLIFDSTRDILYMLETDDQEDFRYVSVNKQFLLSTGLKEEQVIGKRSAEIVPPAIWPGVLENYRKAIRLKEVIEWEEVIAEPIGNRAGIVSIAPVFDLQGRCTFLIGTFHDITEIRKYITRLKEANDRFNLITQAGNDALWEWNIITGELWANEAHQRLYGLSLNDPIPDSGQWADRLHPDERDRLLKRQQDYLSSSSETFISEYRFRCGTGEYLNIYDRCFIVRDDTGKPVRMLGSMVDITEIRKAQEEINTKATQLKLLGDNLSGTMIYQLVREKDGRMAFTYLSREVEILTGYQTEEVLENPQILYNVIHEEDRKKMADAEAISYRQMTLFNVVVRAVRPDGEIRWLNIRSVPRLLPDGRVIWDGVHLDITEQRMAQEKIMKEMNLSDSLINSLPGIFYLYTKERKFLRWNKNFERVSGYNADEISLMDPLDFFEEEEKELLFEKIKAVFEHGEENVEAGFRTKSGVTIPYFFTGQTIDYNKQTCLMGVGIDISERVKAQAAIKQVSEQLRRLSAHLLAIRDEERKRIGREIHDELGQHLTAIKMDVAWIEKKIPADAEPIRQKLRNMITLLDSSHLSLRKILNELRMGILEHQGLEEALKWQVSLFTDNTGIPVSFRIEKPFELKDEAIASCLFRVFQESLTNITRYAHAKQVKAFLRQEPGMIRMEIADDGVGFDAAILNNPVSFGILGMRERVAALEGKFLLDTQPGKGTTITVSIPYHE